MSIFHKFIFQTTGKRDCRENQYFNMKTLWINIFRKFEFEKTYRKMQLKKNIVL